MNSVMDKTRLVEKRYRDELKKIKLNREKHLKNSKKIRKSKGDYKKYNHQLKQPKKQKITKKEYELNKRRTLVRKQNEANKEKNQNERKRKRENMVEDFDLGRFFELATSNKINVNGLNLHEIKNEILLDFTVILS